MTKTKENINEKIWLNVELYMKAEQKKKKNNKTSCIP